MFFFIRIEISLYRVYVAQKTHRILTLDISITIIRNFLKFYLHKYRLFCVKPGADDGFLSGEIENILFTPTKTRGFLSPSSADGGQSFGQSFVHMTSAPAMIGYMRKMFRGFVGITRRRRTNVFCPRTIVQNIKHVSYF
jgi:hypothetical protein